MDRKIIYVGLFLDNQLDGCLSKKTVNQHVTLAFRPQEGFLQEDLLGKPFQVRLVGYACDLNNEGYRVEIPGELKSNQQVPLHITVSTSDSGKPVNTGYLKFQPIGAQTRTVSARYGYFDGSQVRFA